MIPLRSNLLRRTLLSLPLMVYAAVNLAGTFYTKNLYDFNTFVRAGEAIVHGGNPYDLSPRDSTNLNPPLTLLAFRYLADRDPAPIFQAWRVISFLLFLVSLALLARAYRGPGTPTKVVVALCMTGIWYTLLMGQLYALLMLLATGAWLLLKDKHPIPAGILIGVLAAIKPNFLLWPLLLILAGSWQAAAASFATFGGLSLLPLLAYGPELYRTWVGMLLVYPAGPLPTNVSIFGLTSRLGLSGLGNLLAIGLVAGVAGVVWRRRPALETVSGLALTVALLATPFAWVGYTILLLPIFFSRRWTPPLIAAAALLCAPSIIVFAIGRLSDLAMLAIGMVYFSGMLLVLWELVRPLIRPARGEAEEQAV